MTPIMYAPHSRGYSALELLLAVSVAMTLSGVAIPQLQAAVDDYRAAGAARYVATRVQRARMEAVGRSANVALRFTATASGYAFAMYADGNGDGVLTKDITKGIDPRVGAVEQLADTFAGVDFGVLPGLPPVESGSPAPGTDPIKLGAGDLLSFSASGTSSSGSLYIRGRGGAQYVLRVLGETGRARLLVFDPQRKKWRPL